MGNVRSGPCQNPNSGNPATKNAKPALQASSSTDEELLIATPTASATIDDRSTSALIQAILPVVLPIALEIASHQCISQNMVLFEGEMVERLEEAAQLPIGPVDVVLDHIRVLTPESLEKDMNEMPEFEWPEAERYKMLMSQPTKVDTSDDKGTMIVLDITGVALTARLAPGIELAVPVDTPMEMAVNLEVGTGGSIPQAMVHLEVPKLRVWFVNRERYKLYIAFMARPRIVPHVHINVNRGYGDFWDIEFKGDSGLDDAIESILCGFGPSSVTYKEQKLSSTDDDVDSTNAKTSENRSWVADALGRRISDAIGTFAGVGRDRPLELDLHDAIQAGIDTALGKKVRSTEDIEADIEQLKKELEIAKQVQQKEAQRVTALSNHAEEKKNEDRTGFLPHIQSSTFGVEEWLM